MDITLLISYNIIFTVILLVRISTQSTCRSFQAKGPFGYAINDPRFLLRSLSTGRAVTECTDACLDDGACRSVSFRAQTPAGTGSGSGSRCRLHSTTKLQSPLVKDDGFLYFEKVIQIFVVSRLHYS